MKKVYLNEMHEISGGGTINAVSNCILDAYSNHGFASIILGFATYVSYGGTALFLGAACYAKIHK